MKEAGISVDNSDKVFTSTRLSLWDFHQHGEVKTFKTSHKLLFWKPKKKNSEVSLLQFKTKLAEASEVFYKSKQTLEEVIPHQTKIILEEMESIRNFVHRNSNCTIKCQGLEFDLEIAAGKFRQLLSQIYTYHHLALEIKSRFNKREAKRLPQQAQNQLSLKSSSFHSTCFDSFKSLTKVSSR